MWFSSPVRLYRSGEDDPEAYHTAASEDYPATGNSDTSPNHPDTNDNTATLANDSGSDNNSAPQCAYIFYGRGLKA
jgi:hypothetical protein